MLPHTVSFSMSVLQDIISVFENDTEDPGLRNDAVDKPTDRVNTKCPHEVDTPAKPHHLKYIQVNQQGKGKTYTHIAEPE